MGIKADDPHLRIMRQNRAIGMYFGAIPKEEYCVYCGEDSILYTPSHMPEYFPTAHLQKIECDRWISEYQQKKYRDYQKLVTKKSEWYPFYHEHYDAIMPLFDKLSSNAEDPASFCLSPGRAEIRIIQQDDPVSLVTYTPGDRLITALYDLINRYIWHRCEAVIIKLSNILKTCRVDLTSESATRDMIFEKIKDLGFCRNHVLDHKSIPDFYHPRFGIVLDVKIKGSKISIYKQCLRYCRSEQVHVLLLASAATILMPNGVNGKPAYLLTLGTYSL